MKYEVIEAGGEWIVRTDGVELARFAAQSAALRHVTGRLRQARVDEPVSLRVSYASPEAQTRISKYATPLPAQWPSMVIR